MLPCLCVGQGQLLEVVKGQGASIDKPTTTAAATATLPQDQQQLVMGSEDILADLSAKFGCDFERDPIVLRSVYFSKE